MNLLRTWAVTAALTVSPAAPACPLCDSDTGRQVRAGIRDDFGPDLASVLLPFPVLLALAGLIRLATPRSQEFA
jgi:hypothetical protein